MFISISTFLASTGKHHFQDNTRKLHKTYHMIRNGQDLALHCTKYEYYWQRCWKVQNLSCVLPVENPCQTLSDGYWTFLIKTCKEKNTTCFKIWVRALARDIALCSLARNFTLTVPLSTQVCVLVKTQIQIKIILT